MIRILGAPADIVDLSKASRVRAGDPGVDIIDGAIIPLIAPATFPRFEGEGAETYSGWKAAAYDRDGRVCSASLLDRSWTRVTIPFEAAEIERDAPARHYKDAVYGGVIFRLYGHFLLESTNRLWWAIQNDFKGPIIFQGGGRIPEYISRFFELIGWADQVVFATSPVKVDKLIVPHRSLVIQKYIHACFRTPFLKAGAAAESYVTELNEIVRADAAGVYLTRNQYNFRRSLGEMEIENIFRRNDYDIVSPERLKIEHQIAMMRSHDNFAGILGSAFHNLLFSEHGLTTTCICRDSWLNTNYLMIDEIMNNDATYIYTASTGAGYDEDVVLNGGEIKSRLRATGLKIDA